MRAGRRPRPRWGASGEKPGDGEVVWSGRQQRSQRLRSAMLECDQTRSWADSPPGGAQEVGKEGAVGTIDRRSGTLVLLTQQQVRRRQLVPGQGGEQVMFQVIIDVAHENA